MIDLLLGADKSLFKKASVDVSKKLFKKYVNMIEVEAFSYCNRVCWFCPNSFIDRRTENHFLNLKKFETMLQGLSEISYDKMISFSRYNEPFSSDEIFSYASLTRKYLPKSRIHTNTNGDYINMDVLDRANVAGFNSICIQVYTPKDCEDDPRQIELHRNKILQRIPFLTFELVRNEAHWVEHVSDYRGMVIRLRWRDFKENGINRAGIKVSECEIRKSPCIQPITKVYIDHNGCFMPCCNLRSDWEKHKSAIVGNLQENRDSIFEVYGSMELSAWRKNLSNFNEKDGVCADCKFGELTYETLGNSLVKYAAETKRLLKQVNELHARLDATPKK